MKLANRHVFIVGGSGQGKSTAEIKDLIEETERGKSAIVCLDPHGPLAQEFFAHLCQRGHEDRVLYDRLSDLDRVLRWDFLSPSRAKDKRLREGENETACGRFAEILLRRRGKASAADSPDIEEWLLAALNLYIYQRKRRPLADIRYAFQFDHPVFQEMMDRCTHDDTRRKFEQVIESRQQAYKAAERLIEGTCRSVAFRVRTEHAGGFSFERHLNNKGILIVEGGEGGPISPEALRTMLGTIVLKTLSFLRERKREFPNVVLVMDEANNVDLIGEAGHEIRALGELRKWGLAMHVMVQHLEFPGGDKTVRAIFSNCDTRRYFKIGDPRNASRLGEDLGGHYETDGTKRRHYKDGSTWDAPSTDKNYFADELRNLTVGECYVRRGNSNTKERITPLSDPFGYSPEALEAVIDGYLQKIKQRPEYYSPSDDDDELPMDDSPAPPDRKPDDDSPFGI